MPTATLTLNLLSSRGWIHRGGIGAKPWIHLVPDRSWFQRCIVAMLCTTLLLGSIGAAFNAGSSINTGNVVANAAINGVIEAGISTGINGGKFENAFLASFANNLAPSAANGIADLVGDTKPPDGSTDWGKVVGKDLIHAAAGCAMAAASHRDCGAGAIGAGVGELTAEVIGANFPLERNEIGKLDPVQSEIIKGLGQLTAVGVAAAAGKGDSAATASFFAGNAVENNYLNHTDAAKLKELENKCKQSNNCSQADLDKISALKEHHAKVEFQALRAVRDPN